MKRPQTPWSKYVEKKLEPYELYVDIALAIIIIFSIFMLFFGSRSVKTAWAVYMWAP